MIAANLSTWLCILIKMMSVINVPFLLVFYEYFKIWYLRDFILSYFVINLWLILAHFIKNLCLEFFLSFFVVLFSKLIKIQGWFFFFLSELIFLRNFNKFKYISFLINITEIQVYIFEDFEKKIKYLPQYRPICIWYRIIIFKLFEYIFISIVFLIINFI